MLLRAGDLSPEDYAVLKASKLDEVVADLAAKLYKQTHLAQSQPQLAAGPGAAGASANGFGGSHPPIAAGSPHPAVPPPPPADDEHTQQAPPPPPPG